MTPVFTLIAYRPDGYDSRDRTSSSSDHQVFFFENVEELIAQAAKLQFASNVAYRKDYCTEDYEFTVLYNGQNQELYDRADDDHYGDEIYRMFDDIHEQIKAAVSQLHADEEAEQVRRKAVEAAEKAKAAVLAKAQREQKEKELLATLIAKHGLPES